jgi:enoyl-CoA hydratase
MTMDYQNILVASENAIATITINRPTKLNALNKETIQELHQAIQTLEKDATVRVIIITGSGRKSFCCRCRYCRIC